MAYENDPNELLSRLIEGRLEDDFGFSPLGQEAHVYQDEPYKLWKGGQIKTGITDKKPEHEYLRTLGSTPMGGGWQMPTVYEMGIGKKDDSDYPSQFWTTTFGTDSPAFPYGPREGEMRAEKLPGGGFDFGKSQLRMGKFPSVAEMAAAVAMRYPEGTKYHSGSPEVKHNFPLMPQESKLMTDERWAELMGWPKGTVAGRRDALMATREQLTPEEEDEVASR